MVKKIFKHIFNKLFIGFIIYFAVINIVLLNQYGMLFGPYESLTITFFNLFEEPKIIAWGILIICELIAWMD